MRILVLDPGRAMLGVCMRFQEAGHDVRLWSKAKAPGEKSCVGQGWIRLVEDWHIWVKWADLIWVCDNVMYHDDLDKLFAKGYPIFGCNREAAQLELNRSVGQEALKKCGVPIVPYEMFTNYDKAIEFVNANKEVYASKPFGDGDKALSFVPDSRADLVFKLERWKEEAKLKDGFMLQKKVDGMSEMAVGGWFGKGGWSQWKCENWEHKKMMNDDLGVNVGEQGTVLRYVEESELFKRTLEPCTALLKKLKYVGYVDMNCLIQKAGDIACLEWTMRDGQPLRHIQQALHTGDPADWMLDLVQGRDTLEVSEDIAVGVVLSHGDYPYGHLTQKTNTGIPVRGITDENQPHLSYVEMMLGIAPVEDARGKIVTDEVPVTCGDYVMIVTGTGPTVSSAAKNCYDVFWQIDYPSNKGGRTDIGKKLKKQIPKLNAVGLAQGMVY